MQDEIIKDTVDSFNSHSTDKEERGAITIWVPSSYKQKFDDLQNSSDKNFGKCIREMIIKTIDKVI